MAFSSRVMLPDRSKVSRSPIAPKKSPCQTIPRPEGLARKCSSPVFTRSPSRSTVKRALPSLPKTPDHQQKENALPGTSRPSPGAGKSTKSLPTRPPVAASPKKIFGDHNATLTSSKRCRKEWQIPSPSALELKESLSGMESPAETAGSCVDQASEFTVNCEVLEEPEPVVGWIQKRYSQEVPVAKESKNARKLFEDLETVRENTTGYSPPSQHSFAGSSTIGTEQEEDEQSSKSSVRCLTIEGTQDTLDQEDTSIMTFGKQASEISSDTPTQISGIQETWDVVSASDETITFQSQEKITKRRLGPNLSWWSVLLGCIILLGGLSLLTIPRERTVQLWERGVNMVLAFPAEVEWTSEAEPEIVGLFVDPQQLQMHLSSTSAQLLELYAKCTYLFSNKLGKFKFRLEDFGIRSIRLVGSYYSSLVLENHAKDILFNYCDKFHGQYHRLRFVVVSLIEQIVPLEAAVRNTLASSNLEDYVRRIGSLLAFAEHYAYEALVENYLRLGEENMPSEVSGKQLISQSAEPDNHELPEYHSGPETFREPEENIQLDEVSFPEKGLEEAQDENHDLSEHLPTVEAAYDLAYPGTEVPEGSDFSSAVDWTGDVVSVCNDPDLLRAATLSALAFTPAVAGRGDIAEEEYDGGDGETDLKQIFNAGLFLLAISTLVSLGSLGSYLLYCGLKAHRKPKASRLSPAELLRMRGADEKLILSPEQQAAEYSPYGSFTAYKRIVHSEGVEKEREVVTPVRRSSRIRNQVRPRVLG